ncbi:MAG: sigma-54 dependent transcriptional regulator [Acidobacteriia bacterium]|jgi:DNA-binding NtrC family response regulator|nr:sigma-54 dependent transcriptional regulator [Terriglobia bacterium]
MTQADQSVPAAARVDWVAHDPASQRVLELARRVAETNTTVLITGESGTGKDQLARLIHELSPRRDAPYLKIDCASLPPELVESELFGHERGAFTGAVERKLGRFELARGGTIVLDEVAALSLPAQAKLLRVLEERTFERLGGTETLRIDARLIALTNADLARVVAEGCFREDLYFRLNVLTIAVPRLRDRPADIVPLAEQLLGRLAVIHGRPGVTLSDGARRLLETYAWPGNVRELKNALERALVLSGQSVLQPEDFPDVLRAAADAVAGLTAGLRSLEEIERDAIRQTLEATRYKITRAAEILGISRKTLLEKRKKYGLD